MSPFWQPLHVNKLLTRFSAGWLLSALLALPLSAQETASPTLPSGRLLFLVDTSFSMRSRADGLLRTVEALLASELDGRLRPGDSIGLWTFNADVYAGRFPLQTWTPPTRSAATANVLEFLRQQRYEKKTDLDKALRKALPLVRASPAITLVLFTDGEHPVRGTPFDDAINATFQDSRRAQARVRMPFVTVLRAEGGQIVNHVVGLPPWRIEVPLLPLEQKALAAKQSPRKPAPKEAGAGTAATKPPPTVSTTVADAKPTPKLVEPPKPDASPAKPPQPAVTLPAVAEKTTEAKSVEKPPAAAPKPVTVPGSDAAAAKPLSIVEPPRPAAQIPPPASDMGKAQDVAITPISATKPPPPVVLETSPVAAATPEPPKPVTGNPASPTVPVVPEAKPVIADTVPKPEPVRTVEPSPARPTPVETKASASPESKPAAAAPEPTVRLPEISKAVGPLAAEVPAEVQSKPALAKPPPASVAEPQPSSPIETRTEAAAVAAGQESPAQTALAVPPQPFMSGPPLLVLGLLLLGVAGVLFLLIVRRSRAAGSPGSLITQSFDRDRKQP